MTETPAESEPDLFDCPECDHEVAPDSSQFHAPGCSLGASARPETPAEPLDDLPDRVVVGANGAYWRAYVDHYSMCPVSTDNDPVEVVAVYTRESAGYHGEGEFDLHYDPRCPRCIERRDRLRPDPSFDKIYATTDEEPA